MIGLLNVFRLERDGQVLVEFYDRTNDLLLAYLALHPGKAHARDQIATLLWPDKSAQLANNRLAVTLHVLRKQLAAFDGFGDTIVTNRHVLQLHPAISTDVQRFEDGVAAAFREHDSREQVRFLEPALRLYGQGLLPMLSEAWVLPERERLAGLYDRAVQLLADALKREGMDDRSGALGPGTAPEDLVRFYLRGQALKFPAAQRVATSSRDSGIEPSQSPLQLLQETRGAPPLVASPATVHDLRRHNAERSLALAEQAEPHLAGAQRGLWLDRLDTEYDNIRAALEWAFEKGDAELGIRLSGALWRYWLVRSRVGEGRLILERALGMKAQPRTAADARALHGAGSLALQDGDLERSRAWLEAATAIWRKLENYDGIARALNNVGIAAQKSGDYAAARKAHEESLRLIRKVGTPETLAIMLRDAALVEIADGNNAMAEALLQERLRIGQSLDDGTMVASTLSSLGTIAETRGDHAQARVYVEEALRLSEAANDLKAVAYALRMLGYITRMEGDLAKATELYESSKHLSESLQDIRGIGETLRYLGEVSEDMQDVEKARTYYAQSLMLLESAGDLGRAAESRAALEKLAQHEGASPPS